MCLPVSVCIIRSSPPTSIFLLNNFLVLLFACTLMYCIWSSVSKSKASTPSARFLSSLKPPKVCEVKAIYKRSCNNLETFYKYPTLIRSRRSHLSPPNAPLFGFPHFEYPPNAFLTKLYLSLYNIFKLLSLLFEFLYYPPLIHSSSYLSPSAFGLVAEVDLFPSLKKLPGVRSAYDSIRESLLAG